MGYKWKPSAQQKAEYHRRMVAIEAEKNNTPKDDYNIVCTGDCCTGDEVAFFNARKASERIYGKIISESYGEEKQQHTFSIETENGIMRIKGRNLYSNGVYRKPWLDENERQKVLNEKHERGYQARLDRKKKNRIKRNEF